MIDTIGLKIKVDKEILHKIASNNHRLLKYQDIKEGEIVRTYQRYNSKFACETWRSEVFFNLDFETGHLFFPGFSLPKWFFGSNVVMLFDVQTAIKAFKVSFEEIYDVILPELSKWHVIRLDLCFNKRVSSQEIAYKIFEYIKKLEYPRKQPHIYKTTLLFPGKYYSFKVYLKYDEYIKHDFKKLKEENHSIAYEYLRMSEGIIRIEASLSHSALKDYFMSDTDKQDISGYALNVTQIDVHWAREQLNIYIDKMLGNRELLNKELDIENKLLTVYKKNKVRLLLGYYYYYERWGKDKTIQMYGKSTFYESNRSLKDVGIGRFNEDTKELEDLEETAKEIREFKLIVSDQEFDKNNKI